MLFEKNNLFLHEKYDDKLFYVALGNDRQHNLNSLYL